MPMLDLHYPEGALSEDARARAVERLTGALLRHEGAPEDSDYARAMAWVFTHELPPAAVNVAGAPADRPVYRVFATVPEGTLLHGPGPFAAQSRRNLVREVTEILLEAEGTGYTPAEAARVYCLIREIRDGWWGGLGTTFRMEDIIATAVADAPQTEVSEAARAAVDDALAL
jgi:phenylpyruvate tautomerase PptA (4-oxalocrotonate tautomerase family)